MSANEEAFQSLRRKFDHQPMKETFEEIAADWLEEALEPFPALAFSQETFQIVEAPDPQGGTLRFLVPLDGKRGFCYYLRKP